METATKLLTVEEYDKIPDPPGGRYELHHGELYFVSYPEKDHTKLQARLQKLLELHSTKRGVVLVELPFRATPEHELRAADVGYVTVERYRTPERWLTGAPELVIEALSPSITASKMMEKTRLCLSNGSIQFWEVDAGSESVRVSRRDGTGTVYERGEAIPLDEIFGKGQLAVDDIFSVEGA